MTFGPIKGFFYRKRNTYAQNHNAGFVPDFRGLRHKVIPFGTYHTVAT